MPPSQPPTEHTLLSTTDATEWAREFCRIFDGKTINQGAGVDIMIGWFANAIETGRRAGSAEWTVTDAEEADEIVDDDAPDDEDEEPTLEESFKEGFDEGR